MRNNYMRFSFIIIFVCMVLLFSKEISYSKTLKLNDTDLVYTDADFKNDVLKLSFSYINREKNSSIYWEKGSVDCNCEVYPIDGNYNKLVKNPIASFRKFLSKNNDAVFIDVPGDFKQKYRNGVVECTMQIGWKNLETQDRFYVY